MFISVVKLSILIGICSVFFASTQWSVDVSIHLCIAKHHNTLWRHTLGSEYCTFLGSLWIHIWRAKGEWRGHRQCIFIVRSCESGYRNMKLPQDCLISFTFDMLNLNFLSEFLKHLSSLHLINVSCHVHVVTLRHMWFSAFNWAKLLTNGEVDALLHLICA